MVQLAALPEPGPTCVFPVVCLQWVCAPALEVALPHSCDVSREVCECPVGRPGVWVRCPVIYKIPIVEEYQTQSDPDHTGTHLCVS